MYSASQAAKLLMVSSKTVKRWTSEFSRFLSSDANQLNEDDVGLLALVAEMEGKGSSFIEIYSAIEACERSEPPDPIYQFASPEERKRLDTLKQEIVELKKEIELVRAARVRSERQVELLEKQYDETLERLFRRDWPIKD